MRNMSFMETRRAMYLGIKSVTRRKGWDFAEPGMQVMSVEKSQGLKKGEHVREIGVIEFINVSKQALGVLRLRPAYARYEIAREGFPVDLSIDEFISKVTMIARVDENYPLNRIEFERHYNIPVNWKCPECGYLLPHFRLVHILFDADCLKCRQTKFSEYQYVPIEGVENDYPYIPNFWRP